MESTEDDDGGLYERLMRDDARINAQLSDLRAAHRAGALDREAFLGAGARAAAAETFERYAAGSRRVGPDRRGRP